MKKTSLLLVLLIISAISVNAQLLWKISGNGLEKPSYIFGTHHIAPANFTDSIAGFNRAFDSCSQLYGEIDMADMASLQSQVSGYVMAPQDSTLNKLYSADDFSIITEGIKNILGADVNQLLMIKPVAISQMIAQVFSMQAFPGFNPQMQLDATLQLRAKNTGKTVKGLESAISQCELLFNEPMKDQAEDLLKMIKDPEKAKRQTKELADSYVNQDLEMLKKVMLDPEMEQTEEDLEKLMYNRNRNWVKQMPETMKTAPTFFVVGAGHIIQDGKGVLDLRRNAGYTVEPANK